MYSSVMTAALVVLIAGAARAEVKMVFDPAAAGRDYFAVPYPNDLHRYPDGRVDRRGFPVPADSPLSVHYRNLSDGMDGFAVTESVFIRFDGAIDGARLPGPEESVKPGSPVFLVNADKNSPGYGERVPVWCWFHAHERGPLHNLLAICPYPGFVLREDTVYAAVVMRSLDPALATPDFLRGLLSGYAAHTAQGLSVFKVYQPLAEFLRDQGIAPADVAAATVYTTGDPTAPLRSIIAWTDAQPTLELDAPLAPFRDHPAFYALNSSFTAPQFQTGRGGQFLHGGKAVFDQTGAPVVQRTEKIPVIVMVPKGRMPAAGFPLVIYLHGGGNGSNEFLDHIIKGKGNEFTPGEGPARVFAEQDIAGVSSATVKNPERLHNRWGKRGRTAELPFYNFFRGDVLVANHWQAAADNAALLRLMRGLTIDPSLCPETDASASPDHKIHFDPRYFFGMGFSMGGTILGSWSGVEPGIIATIPAGASGHWGLLIRNFTAVPAKPWFFAWITNGAHDEPMDARWPTISIIQAVLEPCDTITFAPHLWQRPFPGAPAKNVYLAVGANDFYTKPVTQNAIITALGLPLAGQVRDDSIMMNERLIGHPAPENYPVRQNVQSEDGRPATAAALQYEPDAWTHEGHNVDYNLTETKHQYGCFLRTLIDTGAATIPAPGPEGSPCE
ncbi:MAG TPA: hypothetical protein VM658_00745 [bacterium]|nr:hypothetical protein [bacterium]